MRRSYSSYTVVVAPVCIAIRADQQKNMIDAKRKPRSQLESHIRHNIANTADRSIAHQCRVTIFPRLAACTLLECQICIEQAPSSRPR